MSNGIDNIIFSYEARLQSLGVVSDTTHQILQGLQDSLLDTKQEREKVHAELRESLAQNKSLRRKDFDNMMQGILSTQDEREKEVRDLLSRYLNEQKEMSRALREDLGKFKDSLSEGEVQRVREFHEMIKQILAKQDERKNEITSGLKEFQKEQQEMIKRLKGLLAKGRELRIRDLKSMLMEFKGQHEGRIAIQKERKGEVLSMLSDFKKKRDTFIRHSREGGNPDAVPVKTGVQNTKGLDARLKTSGMTNIRH